MTTNNTENNSIETIEIKRSASQFSFNDRIKIIEDYLKSNMTKEEVWRKYTGNSDKGSLIRWMRKLGYNDKVKQLFNKMDRYKNKIENANYKLKYKNILNDNKKLKEDLTRLKISVADKELENRVYKEVIKYIEKEHKIKVKKNLF